VAVGKIYAKSETGCCPKFDPKPWDGKLVKWKGKLFLKDRVASFFHIPLNFGKVMTRNMAAIAAAGAIAKTPLLLCDESSLWGSDLFIAVGKPVPGKSMEKISGTFLTKVFSGSFGEMGKWIKEMNQFVKSKGRQCKTLYFWYTLCPKCAKHYGQNYVVLVARV